MAHIMSLQVDGLSCSYTIINKKFQVFFYENQSFHDFRTDMYLRIGRDNVPLIKKKT